MRRRAPARRPSRRGMSDASAAAEAQARAQLDTNLLVDADEPPLRLFLGSFPLTIAERVYADRLATWRAWQPVSERAQGDLTSR